MRLSAASSSQPEPANTAHTLDEFYAVGLWNNTWKISGKIIVDGEKWGIIISEMVCRNLHKKRKISTWNLFHHTFLNAEEARSCCRRRRRLIPANERDVFLRRCCDEMGESDDDVKPLSMPSTPSTPLIFAIFRPKIHHRHRRHNNTTAYNRRKSERWVKTFTFNSAYELWNFSWKREKKTQNSSYFSTLLKLNI